MATFEPSEELQELGRLSTEALATYWQAWFVEITAAQSEEA